MVRSNKGPNLIMVMILHTGLFQKLQERINIRLFWNNTILRIRTQVIHRVFDGGQFPTVQSWTCDRLKPFRPIQNQRCCRLVEKRIEKTIFINLQSCWLFKFCSRSKFMGASIHIWWTFVFAVSCSGAKTVLSVFETKSRQFFKSAGCLGPCNWV